MATEIERKFLVDLECLAKVHGELKNGTKIKQAYIATQDHTVVRLRVAGEQAFLTLKGKNNGISRSEFEYPVPPHQAEQIIKELCHGPSIDKTRYLIPIGQHTWELDIFHGDNQGLVVAEVELETEQQDFQRPSWVTLEVSAESKYYNSSLINRPYSTW
jgi:adenylate cyclase